MNEHTEFSGFVRQVHVASGGLIDVALELQEYAQRDDSAPIVLIDDSTGNSVSISLHGTADDLRKRLEPLVTTDDSPASPPARQGRGRPRLGVVSREVSLLPRHWEWLAEQPGGASAALRKLVEQARRESGASDRSRKARDAAYRFMHIMAGDHPGFEEAIRALFAGDADRFDEETRGWPEGIRNHARKLAAGAFAMEGAERP